MSIAQFFKISNDDHDGAINYFGIIGIIALISSIFLLHRSFIKYKQIKLPDKCIKYEETYCKPSLKIIRYIQLM